MKWESLTLGELCRKYNGKIQTGPFGSQLHQSDYKKHGTPVVMPKDIVNDQISLESIARIEEKDVERLSKHTLKKGDIVFPRRGEISKRALVREENEGFICGTGCLKISINSEHISNLYLNYYLARKESVDWLENNAVGSTMKNISGEILSNVPIELPPLSTQQKIAAILSAYDDLIENNLRRIRLLEEAAQHLYREWFVRFRFPGWEEVKVVDGLPEGWVIKRADKIFDISIGKTPPRNESEWFKDGKTEIKWVSIKDMNQSTVFVLETSESITVEGVNKFNMNVAYAGTVILSFKLTIGAVAIVNEDMVTNEAIAHFNISDIEVMNNFFTYCYLKNFNYDSLGSTSSIGRAINSKIVKSMPFLLPDKSVVELFGEVAMDFFAQIKNLLIQNQKLKEARDILLPRLMNQTIEV